MKKFVEMRYITRTKNNFVIEKRGKMKNELLKKEEIQQFKSLFSKFCRGEVNANRCYADTCEWCPINNAYNEIFGSLESDDDDGFEED